MVHCFSEMQRRDRLTMRRAAAEAATPTPTNREEEEHIDESINVPKPGSEPRPESSRPVGPTSVHVDMEHMAQMLAAAFQQPRESGASIERARKLGARPYDGTGEPERAYSWLETNEEIFRIMGCTEDQRVSFSAFLMKDRAKDWWRAPERRHPEGVGWVMFRREFLDRFYPRSYKEARVKEFYRLVQGNLSVSEYEKRFSELGRLVPSVFDDEEQKTNKFRSGLNSNIRPYVTSSSLTRYGEMVDTAIRVEQSMEPTPQPQKSGQKRSWIGNSSKQGGPSKVAKKWTEIFLVPE